MDNISIPFRFEYLTESLNNIKNHFAIDGLKNDVGAYLPWDELNQSQKSHVRAYIALCHAEIESHFEQWASYIVGRAYEMWKLENKVTLPLLSLCIHYKFIKEHTSTAEKIDDIVGSFKKDVIEKNNSIKTDKLVDLFKPLGMDRDSIISLAPILDSFGKKRGAVVHNSIQVQQPLDIASLINNVNAIQNGIKEFESLLDGIL